MPTRAPHWLAHDALAQWTRHGHWVCKEANIDVPNVAQDSSRAVLARWSTWPDRLCDHTLQIRKTRDAGCRLSKPSSHEDSSDNSTNCFQKEHPPPLPEVLVDATRSTTQITSGEALGPLLGEALKRIHTNDSVISLLSNAPRARRFDAR